MEKSAPVDGLFEPLVNDCPSVSLILLSVVHIPCAFQQFVFNIKSGSVVLLIGIDENFSGVCAVLLQLFSLNHRRYRIRLLTVSSQLQMSNISLIVRDGKAYADQSGAIWDQRNRNRAGFVSF